MDLPASRQESEEPMLVDNVEGVFPPRAGLKGSHRTAWVQISKVIGTCPVGQIKWTM